MMNEHYPDCRTLPAINETFPQFSRPLSLISPLDLSLRAPNAIPITPPTTPSPPRKRQRLMSDESFLWRPHIMPTFTQSPPATVNNTATTATTNTKPAALAANYLHSNNNISAYYPSEAHTNEDNWPYKSNLHSIRSNNFVEFSTTAITTPATPATTTTPTTVATTTIAESFLRSRIEARLQHDLATIYVDDETIILTEDEDETLVSSHDYTEDTDEEEEEEEEVEEAEDGVHSHAEVLVAATESTDIAVHENHDANDDDDDNNVNDDGADDEEEYVDILSNDDDDLNPLSNKTTTALLLQSQLQQEANEVELEQTGRVLTRNKLVYDNEELHQQAINGLAKLFDNDFQQQCAKDETQSPQKKTYTDLSNYPHEMLVKQQQQQSQQQSEKTSLEQHDQEPQQQQQQQQNILTASIDCQAAQARPVTYHKSHKSERKRMKLRKHHAVDEETISPVSGTIIRKLRDDEELVVRKGDIDPAFNVVEITEEAKAILASIDNKIGAYLCQLCRTLYDDAFMLAQHRCPRIVHIEYKCSECEKVFNCPANLASHRRWHKPKSELLANSQGKKRHTGEHASPSQSINLNDKSASIGDGADGFYPCTQCGKTFRRHAYLKKHQTSHQILENLKTFDIFKNTHAPGMHHLPHSMHQQHQHHPNHQTQQQQQGDPLISSTTAPLPPTRLSPNSYYNPNNKPFAPRFTGQFPFPPFDQRRFYSLGELYLTQHLERSSAFQYVHANNLRNLSTVNNNNLLPRPMFPPLIPMPVK